MADILQPWQVLLAVLAGWINRHQQAAIDYLREENRILHEHLGKQRLRLSDDQRRRLAVAGKALGRRALNDLACLFSPDTILAWHRKLVAAKWDHHGKRRGPGRPGVMKEIETIVVRCARENPRWDYRRIEGVLANLGHRVARSTVANILTRHGLDPAPERGRRTSWRTFLGAHWNPIAAIDFATVEVWCRHGLVTFLIPCRLTGRVVFWTIRVPRRLLGLLLLPQKRSLVSRILGHKLYCRPQSGRGSGGSGHGGEAQGMNVITGSIFACTILSMATYVQAQEYVQTVAPNTTPQAQSPRAGGAPILNAPLLDGKQIEAIARAAEPPKEATQQDRSDLNQIAALLRTGKQDEANSVWIRVAQRHAGSKKEGGKDWIELQSWSSYVLHQAFIKPDPVLSAGAAKVRATPVAHEVAHVTQQPRAARVGDDAQLANVDLQNALQKQQQTLQTMSNISKMLHDTATSVIRKIGS